MLRIDKNTAEDFNSLRLQYQGKKFTRNEITTLLFDNVRGMYRDGYVISTLVKNHALNKCKMGKLYFYTFTKDPIHINTLSQALFEARGRIGRKDNKSPENQVTVVNSTPMSEDYCVNYLKRLGYKILKRTVTYEEV